MHTQQVALLPPHAHTHAHTFAPSLQVSAALQVALRCHGGGLGTQALLMEPRHCSCKRDRDEKERSGDSPLPGTRLLWLLLWGTRESPERSTRAAAPGDKVALGCQRVPGCWPSPSEVLTWTSSPWRTLWASSAPGLRTAEEGSLPEALGDTYSDTTRAVSVSRHRG